MAAAPNHGRPDNDGTIDQTGGTFFVEAGSIATNDADGTYNVECDGVFVNGSGNGAW